jgi:phosphoglycerate dehydrogenase-like enzyme
MEWIQLGSAGHEQVADLPLRSRGIRVTNASGVNDIPIAEWCLMMMLVFERRLRELFTLQEARTWSRDAKFQVELRGRRVGIIGYGNIGRETARLCRSFGMEVWAMNRGGVGPRPLKYVPVGSGDVEGLLPHCSFDLDDMGKFLPSLDYLVVTAALNPATTGFLGERELGLLPPSAVIVNPARAHLIDEAALVGALREERIAGIALDAHYREPLPPDDPFWRLPNAVLTPHISGSSESPQYLRRVWDLFASNLERYLSGDALLNEVSWTDLRAH